jgi:hypothetical protein
MSEKFCLQVPTSTISCKVLLHAANLRHGTDGFNSPPKEGMLRIFSPEKSDGFGRFRTRDLGYRRRSGVDVDVDWFAVQVTPMHLGLKLQALCGQLLVPSVNSSGAPSHAGVRDFC